MTEGFAAIPNWMIRDASVSRRAIVVYGALASRSGRGGIFPSQQQIATDARCDERTVRRAIAELETLGVVERVRRTNAQGHRIADGYVLHPNGGPEAVEEGAEPQRSELSGRDDAYRTEQTGPTGQNAQAVPLIEEEPLKKNPGELFDEFWQVYPRHVAKAAALAKWTKLAKAGTDLSAVVAGARSFATDPNLPEKQFIPHPTTWLSQGRWEDEPLPPREGATPAPRDPLPPVPIEIRRQLAARQIPVEEWLEERGNPDWVRHNLGGVVNG